MKLSVLIPNHNEEFIHEFIQEIERLAIACEIIICNDSESKGKGWALREAFNESIGHAVAFIDGDRDIAPRMLLRLLPFLEDFDVVVGSKRITNSPRRRKIMTRVSRWWFKLLFGVKVDTQTGIKIFKRSVLQNIEWVENSFVFDVELIYNAQQKGYKAVEVPIECEIKKQLAVKVIRNMFMDSLKLYWRIVWKR